MSRCKYQITEQRAVRYVADNCHVTNSTLISVHGYEQDKINIISI